VSNRSHWTRIEGDDVQTAHPAAFDAWRHQSGAVLVLLFETFEEDPSSGYWVWQLDTEHDIKSWVYPKRVRAPIGRAQSYMNTERIGG